uniref:Uncharacterized protein MANES_03G131700 n=1 Tax=Rhizophora mucronata TaxID=61149 RepID=A0A2P2L196_RHIMU
MAETPPFLHIPSKLSIHFPDLPFSHKKFPYPFPLHCLNPSLCGNNTIPQIKMSLIWQYLAVLDQEFHHKFHILHNICMQCSPRHIIAVNKDRGCIGSQGFLYLFWLQNLFTKSILQGTFFVKSYDIVSPVIFCNKSKTLFAPLQFPILTKCIVPH